MKKIAVFLSLLMAGTLAQSASQAQDRGATIGSGGVSRARPGFSAGTAYPVSVPVPVRVGPGVTVPGYIPFSNAPGVGYYYTNPVAPVYPVYGAPVSRVFGAPVATTGGFFRFGNSAQINYWRSPSGFYYPWGVPVLGAGWSPAPIIIVQEGVSQPAQPPISTVLSDMEAYIDQARERNRISQQDYDAVSRRLRDLRSKTSMLRNAAGGYLDPEGEEPIRRDIEMLSRDISLRVRP